MKKMHSIIKCSSYNKYTFSVLLITLFSFFYIQWPVMFTTHDDMYYAMLVKQQIVPVGAMAQAVNTGRFYFLYTMYLYAFPYIFNSVLAVKIICLISIVFSVCSLTYLVYKHIDKRMSMLTVILFFAFAQLNNEHNVFTSYVFHHQVTIGFILLSICHLLTYYKTGQKKYMIYSCILYSIPVFIYEGFLMYSIVIFTVCCYGTFIMQRKKITLKNTISILYDLKNHIFTSIIFLVFYFTWRSLHPAYNYSGAIFELNNLISTIKVVITYAFSLFPGNSFFHNRSAIDINELSDIGTFIKAFLVSITSTELVKLTKVKFKIKQLSMILLILLLGIIVPCIPYGFTAMHVEWVNSGSYGFVPSFFSYFFWILLITLIFSAAYNKIKFKKVILSISFIVIFIGVYITDCNNKYFANYFNTEFNKNTAFDHVVSSDAFLDIPENSTVYIPDYLGLLASMDITEDYLKTYSDKNITLTNHKTDLNFLTPTFMMRYDVDSQCIYWGRIDSDFNTDQVIFYSKEKGSKSAVFGTKDITILENDQGIQQISNQFTAFPLTFSPENQSVLRGKNIQLDTMNIVSDSLRVSTLNLKYMDGFYEEESWGCWSNGSGIIEIENKTNIELNIELELVITASTVGNYFVRITSPNSIDTEHSINNMGNALKLSVKLFPGKNQIKLESDAPPIQVMNDSRSLAFSVSNVKVKLLNNID